MALFRHRGSKLLLFLVRGGPKADRQNQITSIRTVLLLFETDLSVADLFPSTTCYGRSRQEIENIFSSLVPALPKAELQSRNHKGHLIPRSSSRLSTDVCRHSLQAIWRGVPARLGMRDNFDRGAGRMNPDTITISPRPRMRIALLLAIVADIFQIVFSPLFFEGAASPADDILDFLYGGSPELSSWLELGIPAIVPCQARAWGGSASLYGRWLLRTSTGDRSGSRSPWKEV